LYQVLLWRFSVGQANKKIILLVEDEVLIAMTEKMQLEQYGYAVRMVTSGEQAVEAVRTAPDIDLILMDINLGSGIDGTQAAEMILHDHDIPIVFLSSHTDREVVEKTEKISGYGYVVKNSSMTVLDASIKMALKLFASRRLAEDTFDHALDGLCVLRALRNQSGTIRDVEFLKVNSACERHTGLAAEDIVGRTIRDVYPGQAADEVIRLVDDYLSGRRSGGQELYFQPTGAWFRLNIFATRGDEFTAVVHNITERKKQEQYIQEQRELFSMGPAAVMQWHNAEGWPVEYASHNVVDMLGYTPEQLTSGAVPYADLVYPEDLDRVASEVARHRDATTEEFSHEPYRLVTRDGEVRWVADTTKILRQDGEIISYLGYLVDITDYREAASERRKLHTAVQQSQSIIAITDREGTIEYINPRFAQVTGYSREEAIGKNPRILKSGKHPDAFYEELWNTISKGTVWRGEFCNKKKNGDCYWESASISPVFDEGGRITTYIKVAEDMTDRKKAEEEIRKQLKEKEILLREVHHRVKNNMATIVSLLSLQAGSTELPEVKASLQATISRVESTRVLYDTLLISEDLREISIQPYVNDLIDAILKVFDPEQTITIERDIADFVVSSKLAFSLGIIINELLTNVFKYAFPDHASGVVSLSIGTEGGTVSLIIQDNGVGFDEGTLKNESTGFGFTIVQMLVEQSSGTFIRSNDNGTKIVVRFPLQVSLM
jgi:PAS domain S-box-containing protein